MSRRWCGVLALMMTALALTPGAAAVAEEKPSAGPRPTVVSLTFDDGWKNQLAAARLLSDHDMAGTFFVNSGMWTYPAYLSRTQLASMAADGHEIGGHTLTHPHLTKLTARQLRHEICQDRANLLALGVPVTSFAFPYGEHDEAVQEAVQSCGYSSARLVNGLADQPPEDPLCDCVARLPFSADRWAVPVKPTVRSADTAEKLEGWVRQAEQVGGWVPIVFHRICDGCAEESTSLAELTEFVTWLEARPATTRVATLGDVVGAPSRRDNRDDRQLSLPAPQVAPPPDSGGSGRGGPREYAFSIDGHGVGQTQVVLTFILVALVLSLAYRFASRGRRMA